MVSSSGYEQSPPWAGQPSQTRRPGVSVTGKSPAPLPPTLRHARAEVRLQGRDLAGHELGRDRVLRLPRGTGAPPPPRERPASAPPARRSCAGRCSARPRRIRVGAGQAVALVVEHQQMVRRSWAITSKTPVIRVSPTGNAKRCSRRTSRRPRGGRRSQLPTSPASSARTSAGIGSRSDGVAQVHAGEQLVDQRATLGPAEPGPRRSRPAGSALLRRPRRPRAGAWAGPAARARAARRTGSRTARRSRVRCRRASKSRSGHFRDGPIGMRAGFSVPRPDGTALAGRRSRARDGDGAAGAIGARRDGRASRAMEGCAVC